MNRPRSPASYTIPLLVVAILLGGGCARSVAPVPEAAPRVAAVAPIRAESLHVPPPAADSSRVENPLDSAPAGAPDGVQPHTAAEPLVAADERAELGIEVRGRTSLGGSWNRIRPCTGVASERCNASAVPQLAPELQLGVRAGGTVLERLHVAVDYDGVREFDASNDIRFFFEGKPGEWLKRFEAGNVTLALPSSRFLTYGMPTASWGVRAIGALGPVEVQALWAQGGGSVETREFRLSPGSAAASQEVRAVWDDAAYAAGQFFFLFDPAAIRGFPHVDILALSGADALSTLAPAAGIRLYRYDGGPPAQDGSTRMLRALPAGPASPHEAVSGPFRLLQEDVDYQLHRSGLWLSLKQPLREDEALAVAYRTVTGDHIGDPSPERAGEGSSEVRLLRGPRATHQPGSATWPLEMRHIYRVSGSSEVDPASVGLVISRGEASGGDLGRRHPTTGAVVPYLQLLGLDDDLPRDRLDPARVWRPSSESLAPAVAGLFVVFPTLQPFAEPPPVPSLGLSGDDAARILGDAANPRIYDASDERARLSAARFRLDFAYTTRSQGAASIVSLGAIGIREGSERVYLGERLLQRGTDYEITYEVGQIELRGAAAMSGSAPQLRVTFEQMPLIAAAPSRVAGLTARLPLGDRGELNLVGLSYRERSLLRRAALGAEPASLLVGGMAGRMRWDLPWLDRLFGLEQSEPQVQTTERFGRDMLFDAQVVNAPSAPRSELRVAGELAVSLPDPYGDGTAYLEDFEERGELRLPLIRQAWRLGSAPASRRYAEQVLPAALGVPSAGALTWQHEVLEPSGRSTGSLRLGEIDRRIRAAGSATEPNVLYLTMRGPDPSWRSITTVLNPTGRDLRNHEYLEFYVRGAAPGEALVVDVGTVSEDAFAPDAEGRTGGTDALGNAWGEGVLDQEWNPAREMWTSEGDERGLWNAVCRSEPGAVYPLGDPRANCTRGNGTADTEDLNGNSVLDTDERVFRYVVRPGDAASPYLAADTTDTGTGFRLIRIPLDRQAGLGASPDEIRNVRHLRITVAGGGETQLALARMRFVGSRWEKRGGGGVVYGLAGPGELGPTSGRVEVGPISRLSAGEGYVSPPGIAEQPHDPAAAASAMQSAVEYNEQALRIRYAAVEPGARAEVYRLYEGGPRNFLAYREIRLWALAREGSWGERGERLVVRVGSDASNHYLFRTHLRRSGPPRVAADWGTELVVDLDRWLRLRAEAERLLARTRTSPTERDPLTLWDADSTYAVVVTERGRAPNLAAVRELSLAVWNGGDAMSDGEVWINDIRLGGTTRQADMAGEVTIGVRGGEMLQADLSITRRGGEFRQPGLIPTYHGEDGLSLNAAVQLGRLAPAAWGLDAPLTVTLQRSGATPLFLDGTDLEARGLDGVRHPASRRARVDFRLSHRSSTSPRWMRSTVGGLSLRIAASSLNEATPFSVARRADASVGFDYDLRPAPRSLLLLPGGIARWGWLPSSLRSGAGSGADGIRLRWTPVHLSVGTVWNNGSAEHQRFADLFPAGAAEAPGEASAARALAHRLSVAVQPLPSLNGAVQVHSTSDLLASALLNPGAVAVLNADRRALAGVDLGRESERSVTSQLAWAPQLTSWLTLRATLGGTFVMDANSAYLGTIGAGDLSTPVALRSFGNRRTLATRWGIDPAALVRRAGLADPAGGRGWEAVLGPLSRSVRAFEVGWGSTLESRYDRSAARPGLAYQLAFLDRAEDGLGSGGDAMLRADRITRSARSQIALPGTALLTLAYAGADGEQSGIRGERTNHEREWPDILFQWSGVPSPVLSADGILRNASLAAGYVRHERWMDDRASAQMRSTRTDRVPFDVALQWRGGLTSGYRAEWRRNGAHSPSADTRQTTVDHAFSFAGSFQAPGAFVALLPAPLSLALRYTLGGQRECRLSDPLSGCSSSNEFAGYREQAWSVRLDTRASDMNVGLHIEQRDRASRVGERDGYRHFLVGLFGEFNLSAGTLP